LHAMLRLLLHGIGVVAALRSSYDTSLDDAEAYLTSVGIPTGLPRLEIKYREGGFGRKYNVAGADSHLSIHGSVALAEQPLVKWEGGMDGTHQSKYAVMMIDPDAPHRASADGAAAGAEGPVLHWFALNCAESTSKNDDKCYHLRPYGSPHPKDGTGEHRYIFVLFQQMRPPPGGTSTITKYLLSGSRERFDLRGFLDALEGSMEARAINFFYASSEKELEAIAGPSSAGAKKPPPPPALMEHPTGSRSLGPSWESTPPEHDEL